MTLGEKLQMLRRERKYTQEQLAELLGVTRQAVGKWETDSAFPETEKLVRLAKLYGCSLDYLLLDTPRETEKPEPQPVQRGFSLKDIYFERKSTRFQGNLPLWHINIGWGRKAKGVFALGLAAEGVFAVGILARGVVSVGILSLGLLAFGNLALGLLAFGAIAVGAVAVGAIAAGLFAVGAVAAGLFSSGALSVGVYGAVGDTTRAAVAIGKSSAVGSSFSHVGEVTPEVRQAAKAALYEVTPRIFRELQFWFFRFI